MKKSLAALLVLAAFIFSCSKDRQPLPHPSETYRPLSLHQFIKHSFHPAGAEGQRSGSLCSYSTAQLDSMVSELQAELTLQYDADRSGLLCSDLHRHLNDPDFFWQASLVATPTKYFPSASDDINRALVQSPLPSTRADSAARVINYVFTHYPYGSGSLHQPADYARSPMETIAREINADRVAGICSDYVHFFSIIIATKFPHWGYPVELFCGPAHALRHVVSGLADAQGNIYMVLDPTSNVIWVDARQRPLSLSALQSALKTPNTAVGEMSSWVFGRQQKLLSDDPCVLYCDMTPGLAVAYVEPNTGLYVVKGNWYRFNDTSTLSYRSLVYPFYQQQGFAQNTWANQCQLITRFSCGDKIVATLIAKKYGLPAN